MKLKDLKNLGVPEYLAIPCIHFLSGLLFTVTFIFICSLFLDKDILIRIVQSTFLLYIGAYLIIFVFSIYKIKSWDDFKSLNYFRRVAATLCTSGGILLILTAYCYVIDNSIVFTALGIIWLFFILYDFYIVSDILAKKLVRYIKSKEKKGGD